MNINDKIFEDAYVDGKYDKTKFLQIIQGVVSPETLSEGEETVVNFSVQELNDAKKTNISLLDFVDYLKKNKTNLSYKVLVSKISSNLNIKDQLHEYYSKKEKENRYWTIGFGVFILAAVLGVLNYLGYLKLPSFSSGSKVIVINMDKLATSATVDAVHKKLSAEQSQEYANKYRDNLRRVIEGYTDRGYVVMDRSAIYAVNDDQDVTLDILKEMGIPPVSPNEFDINYNSVQKYDALRNFSNANIGQVAQQAQTDSLFKANQAAEQQLQQSDVMTNPNGQSIDVE
ncbi:hypothetical protein [Acinetobacter sp. P1(2025)]|uniref:hypothetical protein n=1 Tax=Acinetobacter sp. P1(2025) TaxID=3446120 RepID=UPI003F5346BF